MPKEANKDLYYQMALSFVPNIGVKTGRVLLTHFGNATNIFKAPLKEIKSIDSIGEVRARGFRDEEVLQKAEKEMAFISKHDIQTLFINDTDYPQRLLNCADAPLLLFYKGNTNLNAKKIVAIVGTRKNTDHGMKLTEDLVEGLQQQEDILIVSGLAYGIDAIAHKKCVNLNMPTVGVLAHGLDRIYPPSNKSLAHDMTGNGGLLTEFASETIPEKGHFPMRNRIVAGMSDVTIVVESDKKGGALITAHQASGYNRDVAAFPGRVGDKHAAGCNELIRTNIAALITCSDDVADMMNWGKPKKVVQKKLFLNLLPEEQKIIDALQTKDSLHADELYHSTGFTSSQLAALLLQLEMQGLVKALPGKHYRMN